MTAHAAAILPPLPHVVRRGVGYCVNDACDDFLKGAFVLNPTRDVYFCAPCRVEGHLELERATWTDGLPFREVRLEFDFEAATGIYHGVAIVRDEGLARGAVYVVKSPIVRTSKRALLRAEGILAHLRSGTKPQVTPSTGTETVFSLDDEREVLAGKLSRWVNLTNGGDADVA